MDTFASSALNLKVPSLHRHSREFYTTNNNTAPPPSPTHISSASKPRRISLTKSSSASSHCSLSALPLLSHPPRPSSRAPTLHQTPATGYSAALIDIAQRKNNLHCVQSDVQRLQQMLRNAKLNSVLSDPSVGEEEKAQVMRQVIRIGKFHRQLEALLKMLVNKNRVGLIPEMLLEFERIYDEMCGTQIVLVSSVKKMKEDQLLGIAETVERFSRGLRVKIRNLFSESLTNSYAV